MSTKGASPRAVFIVLVNIDVVLFLGVDVVRAPTITFIFPPDVHLQRPPAQLQQVPTQPEPSAVLRTLDRVLQPAHLLPRAAVTKSEDFLYLDDGGFSMCSRCEQAGLQVDHLLRAGLDGKRVPGGRIG